MSGVAEETIIVPTRDPEIGTAVKVPVTWYLVIAPVGSSICAFNITLDEVGHVIGVFATCHDKFIVSPDSAFAKLLSLSVNIGVQ